MSEPITPKAEQQVVEGEFIESDKTSEPADNQATPREPENKPDNKSTRAKFLPPFLLTVVIMLVSAGALATAVATWLQLQPVLHNLASAPLPQTNESDHPMLERALEKIAYQHNQLQHQGHELQVQQAQTQQLEENLAQLEAQLAEMQLRIIALNDDLQVLADVPVASAPPSLPQATEDAELNPASPIIQIQDPSLRQDLNQLRSQLEAAIEQLNLELQQLSAQSQQGINQLNDYVQSEQWHQDKQALQAQVESLTGQVAELASQQQAWIEKIQPQITQTLENVTPQLEGFLSRFNQLFSIQKQAEPSEAAE